ncbi:MAG: hypothetical protein KGH58_03580 [Candidatus Micrarchaeota archaeon]|nr:hypothetical protein [Candidatus Micrarchaeota archaeon]
MIADLYEIRETGRYGKGLFATQSIPKGTIDAFRCKKCGTYSEEELAKLPKKELDFLIGHEVKEESGQYSKFCDKRMLYGNHSCNPNTLNAYILGRGNGGASIVVRDIKKGEEATEDYRLFEGEESIHFVGGCRCGEKNCMKKTIFRPPAPKKLQKFWEGKINAALQSIPYVKQPLKAELLKEHPELSPLFKKSDRL